MKTLKNNHGSTLMTALIILVILTSISVVTTLIVGNNSKISLNRVHKRWDTVELENISYDILNKIIDEPTILENTVVYFDKDLNIVSNTNEVVTLEITNNTSNYSLIITKKKLNLNVEVSFDFINKTYSISKFGV